MGSWLAAVETDRPVPLVRKLGTGGNHFVCGVDAGASKTDCVICSSEGVVLARVVGESAAIASSPPFEEQVAHVIASCRKAAQLSEEAIDVVAVGLSGVDTRRTWSRAVAALTNTVQTEHLLVENDAGMALEAATSERPAAVVIAGTGSITYGEDRGGNSRRIGGWGHVLGDEGSGYALSIAAYRAVLRASEGRGPQTHLTDAAIDHHKIPDSRELIDLTKQFASHPSLAASFAPRVIALADDGDAVAERIVADAARHLIDGACVVVDSLDLTNGGIVVLEGGLLVRSGYYAALVRSGIQTARPGTRVSASELPPVAGAALKALRRREPRGSVDDLRLTVARGLDGVTSIYSPGSDSK